MDGVKNRILLFIVLLGLWVVLTYPVYTQELAAGAAVALLLVILPFGKRASLADWRIRPKSILFSIVYIFVFLWALLKSNLDVAFRVLRPKIPVNPGIVKVKTKLKSKLGRLVLANSITLTPGTITVETRDDLFFIHWISVSGENIGERTDQIVRGFEKYLEVIFG